jgi:hypothetical protein
MNDATDRRVNGFTAEHAAALRLVGAEREFSARGAWKTLINRWNSIWHVRRKFFYRESTLIYVLSAASMSAVAAGVEPRVVYARLAAAQMDRTSDTGEVQAGEGTVGDVEDSSEEGSREGSDQGSDEAEGKDDDGADERRADEAPQNPRTKTIVVDPGHVSMAVTLRRRRVPKNQAKMKARCTLLVNRRTPSRRATARSKECRRRGIVHPTRQLEQPSSEF